MTLAPKSHIFILQSGALRDVVLLEPLVTSLAERYPSSVITVACREEFAGIVALFSRPPREVIPLNLDPAKEDTPSTALAGQLNDLDGLLGHRVVELFISADRRPNWFTWYIAAKVQPQRALMAPPEPAPRGLLRVLLADSGSLEVPFEGPSVSAASHPEPERLRLLAEAAGARSPGAQAPRARAGATRRWPRPPGYGPVVKSILESLDLEDGGFIACFPFDDSDSNPAEAARRSWPIEQLWSALLVLADRQPLPLLVVAPEDQAERVQSLASCLDGGLRTWYYSPSDTVLQAGIIAAARAYFGSHSGSVHLAQAYGIAGVSLFGGGDSWPAYTPWAAGSAAIVNPLACFDCEWDCPFSHPLCLAAIPSDTVVQAITRMIDCPPSSAEIITLSETPALAPADLPAVHSLYQAARRERREQQELLLELAHIAQPKPKRTFPLSLLRWPARVEPRRSNS
ncbi:MAG: hypothetical protein R2762_04570 [Bryobacteraceae bacterium]